MDDLNEGALPEKKQSTERNKSAVYRWRESNRSKYNKYMNDYYHANKAKIAQQRRERRLAKQGGTDGI
jgi:hypothetical protein